ncbi:MAG: trehalose-phosphatase [Oricola sp.]
MRSAFEIQPDPTFLPGTDPADTALFLDFDGVLADIVNDPARVSVEAEVIAALGDLSRASGDAVAIISGREIEQLDAFLSPLRLPAAGIHGLERRNGDGRVERQDFDADSLARIRDAVAEFAGARAGLVAEFKRGSVALHYRNRPETEGECLRLADDLESRIKGLKNVRGKMVVEMTLAHRSKADAINDFMREEPFCGRTPFYFGDDITDEDGFRAVNALGGVSVKIGAGPTVATRRLASPVAFRAWLTATARRWCRSGNTGERRP